jgi:uncharacterized membrane protein
MSKNLSRILTILIAIVGVVALYFFVRIMMEGEEAIAASADLQNSIISPFIWFAVLLLIVTAFFAVVGSVGSLLKNPAALKKILISVAAFVVILVISYSMADDGAVYDGVGKMLKGGEAGSTSKLVSAGINFSVALGIIGVVMFAVDFIKSLVSK